METFKMTQYQSKDTREIAYYIENGVYPYRWNGYKCMLSAYFNEDDIMDLKENWYIASEEYRQQRLEYNKNRNKK